MFQKYCRRHFSEQKSKALFTDAPVKTDSSSLVGVVTVQRWLIRFNPEISLCKSFSVPHWSHLYLLIFINWSPRMGSNHQPDPYKEPALPLSY